MTDIGSKTLDTCLAEYLGRKGIMHGSHAPSEIVAREKGVTNPKTAVESEKPTKMRIERQQRQDAEPILRNFPWNATGEASATAMGR